MSTTPQPVWVAVDNYIDDILVGADSALEAALADSARAGLPAISVSPSQGKLLFVLAKAVGARRILELGTLGGYSGIWLARALPAGGRLVTIEAEPKHAGVARGNFERAAVLDRIDMRVGKALDILPRLTNEGEAPFDFVFIDADKINYAAYLDWSIRLCRSGALILADNVVRGGAVTDPASDDPLVQGTRRFMAAVAADPRVSATAIQTVGAKGHDGFAMAIVN